MATNIGALIVELRANSAQFRAEMDGARGALDNTGRSAHGSSQQIARFAAIAIEQVIPGAQGMRVALEKVFQQAFTGGGILQTLGKASLVLAAGLAAFKVGSLITEFTALGTTVAKYKENIEKAAEAQAKFLAGIATQSGLLRGLRKDLAALQGDPLAEVRAAREDREGKIREAFPLGGEFNEQRRTALALSAQVGLEQERKVLIEQRRLRDEADQKLLDSITKQRDEQVKKWTEETTALVEQLKIRSKLRQDFEAQIGEGGLPGSRDVAGGFGAVRTLREQIQKEFRDVEFLRREGSISESDAVGAREGIRSKALEQAKALRIEFGSLPSVLNAIDTAIASVDFGNFGQEIEKARGFLAAFVPTTSELTQRLGQIAQALATTPPATDAAAKAIQELTLDYHNLQFAIYGATIQLQQYNATAAGG